MFPDGRVLCDGLRRYVNGTAGELPSRDWTPHTMAVSPTAPPAKNPGKIMKITEIKISVFEMTGVITPFDLVESGRAGHRRWRHQPRPPKQSHMHVLHVRTDEGLEGCARSATAGT